MRLAPTIIGVAVVAAAVGVWQGFGQTSTTIQDCNAVAAVKVVAKFSEYSCSPSVDFDGNATVDCGTEYWTRDASPTITTRARNAPIVVPVAPEPDPAFAHRLHFDEFSVRRSCSLEVTTEDGQTFREPCGKNPQCVSWRESRRIVKLKTWYDRGYSVELWGA